MKACIGLLKQMLNIGLNELMRRPVSVGIRCRPNLEDVISLVWPTMHWNTELSEMNGVLIILERIIFVKITVVGELNVQSSYSLPPRNRQSNRHTDRSNNDSKQVIKTYRETQRHR